MKTKWFQLTKLQQDAKTKLFSGEVRFIYIKASFVELISPESFNDRTVSGVLCSNGMFFIADIHPAQLMSALDAECITTASIMSAFDKK